MDGLICNIYLYTTLHHFEYFIGGTVEYKGSSKGQTHPAAQGISTANFLRPRSRVVYSPYTPPYHGLYITKPLHIPNHTTRDRGHKP